MNTLVYIPHHLGTCGRGEKQLIKKAGLDIKKHTFLGLLAKIKCRYITMACYWDSRASPKRCTIARAWRTPPNSSLLYHRSTLQSS
ncbi:hypothetical protein J1N35_003129 [Gossypium stocksii]|uniref:Uncharacterized protein n=1 Tax=Gossypium stocksii TaxID=47602 RepID=A0A9D3WP98_9ROSI|nr:hypothetical protein J1N35_003129 [Gossypium stocksii]